MSELSLQFNDEFRVYLMWKSYGIPHDVKLMGHGIMCADKTVIFWCIYLAPEVDPQHSHGPTSLQQSPAQPNPDLTSLSCTILGCTCTAQLSLVFAVGNDSASF